MSRLKGDQVQLFYEFHLGDAVPEDDATAKCQQVANAHSPVGHFTLSKILCL
jgi:hypothetical protein